LDALNIQIDVKVEPTKRRSSAIDIDAIVAKAKKR
jgi:hypothetical protein